MSDDRVCCGGAIDDDRSHGVVETTFPILFITSGRIGDAVLSTGLIDKLVREVPGARFTIAAGPVALPLFEDVPGLDHLIPMEKLPNGQHWWKLWLQVRKRKWGLVVDLRGSLTAHFLKRRRRAVYQKQGGPIVHKVVELARVLQIEGDPPPPKLFLSQGRRDKAAHLLSGPGPILAMAPAANWIGKTWPQERFAQLAMKLTAPDGPMPGGRIALFGGPEDRLITSEIAESLSSDRVVDLTGRLPLLTVAACIERADLFVGNDSGLMHMAAAVGTPTVGLFGPSDERIYGPFGNHCISVRGSRSFDAFVAIDPELNQEMTHMSGLSVARVLEAVSALQSPSPNPSVDAHDPNI